MTKTTWQHCEKTFNSIQVLLDTFEHISTISRSRFQENLNEIASVVRCCHVAAWKIQVILLESYPVASAILR